MPADAAAPQPAPAPPPPNPAVLPHLQQQQKAKPAARAHEGSHRDTVESILIAFILAFIFRAFVVEAFVIPTGSMAPTLMGAHARFTCKDCGYKFQANYSAGSEDAGIASFVKHSEFPTPNARVAPDDLHVDCPNCGYVVHDPDDPDDRSAVPIHYGDRILVLKYAYLFNEPSRWDVVVFKSPDDPDGIDGDSSPEPPNDYGKSWYTTNFIKRLVGKPGETLMILDGDIYVSDRSASEPDDFKIQSKPRHVQEALWRVVCDGEFVPQKQAWRPWVVEDGAGWDVGSPDKPTRVYRFDGQSTGATGTIRFDNGFNAGRAFTDFLAYAQHESGRYNVSDVKLSLLYRRTAGDGPLHLRLTKRDDTFTAELRPGEVKLYRRRGAPAGPDDLGEEVASSAGTVPGLGADAGAPVEVEFMNVDHVVTVRVGGAEVLRATYDPDVAALRTAYEGNRPAPKPEVRITASAQACALTNVSLWRDVYYTNQPPGSIKWGTPDDPVRLGADEYFVLGDNTVISKDARYWTEPVHLQAEDLDAAGGRVPGRFMLGKAFFVYWPAGYRPFGKPPGLLPNFGEMRFIH